MGELPVAPITRMVRKAGAERVSEEASAELVKQVEEYAMKVAKGSVMLAKHAGRKTVKKDDIVKAISK